MFLFNKDSEQTFKARSIEHAYVCIINNDLESARAIFESLDSPRARWGVVFVDILNGFLEHYPTYFEIRNFLEIDLDFLIKNEKLDYIEQLLGSLEYLVEINQEIYKYVARVMYENKLYKASREYLEKSKKVLYRDPELHFMLAKYYIDFNEFNNANYYIDECLNILPDYYPAIQLKRTISANLS